jgi:hypothetical protein
VAKFSIEAVRAANTVAVDETDPSKGFVNIRVRCQPITSVTPPPHFRYGALFAPFTYALSQRTIRNFISFISIQVGFHCGPVRWDRRAITRLFRCSQRTCVA